VDSPVRAGDGFDQDPRVAQDADVAPGGALEDTELDPEPVSGGAGAVLEQFQGTQRPCRGGRSDGMREFPDVIRPGQGLA
jgi:hypothetical protein